MFHHMLVGHAVEQRLALQPHSNEGFLRNCGSPGVKPEHLGQPTWTGSQTIEFVICDASKPLAPDSSLLL